MRCASFLEEQDLLGSMKTETACQYIERRIPCLQELELQSEQAIVFCVSVELRCERELHSDNTLLEGLRHLRREEKVRIDWIRDYLEASPHWEGSA